MTAPGISEAPVQVEVFGEEEVRPQQQQRQQQEPIPAPDATRAGRGRGKAKAKGRGKGKAKAKGKGKARANAKAVLAIEDAASASEPPLPQRPKGKGDIRKQLLEQIGDRDIEDVIAEAKAQVVSCECKIEEATKRLFQGDDEAMREAEEASAAVEAAKLKELQALEKLRASQEARKQVMGGVAEAKDQRAEAMRSLKFLELERESRDKLRELEAAKKAAEDAALAAKKALEESKAKEKELLEAQRAKEAAALQEVEQARKEEKAEEKLAAKRIIQELGNLHKSRAQREKEWRKKLLGLGSAATPVMIEDGPAGADDRSADTTKHSVPDVQGPNNDEKSKEEEGETIAAPAAKVARLSDTEQ